MTVFLAILCSGSSIGMIYGGMAYPVYFICALFSSILNANKISIKMNNLFILSVFLLFYMIHYSYYIKDGANFNGYFGNIILLLSAFFLASQITFEKFKTTYINILMVIALYSLIMYVFGIMFHLYRYATVINNMPVLGLYNYADNSLGRNSGIFWEPGAYQIYLNFAILFLVDKDNNKFSKKDKMSIILFIISVLTTMSTTGYILLSCIMISFILHRYSKTNTIHKVMLLIPMIVILTLLIVLTVRSPAVYRKIFMPNGSTQIRLNDLTQSPKILMNSIYWGIGSGTQTEKYQNSLYGIQYNSVGIYLSAIRYGCIYILFYIYNIFKNICDSLKKTKYVMLILMVVIFFTEGMFELAIMYLFVFSFRSNSIGDNYETCHESPIPKFRRIAPSGSQGWRG